jgi:hypothetical protein
MRSARDEDLERIFSQGRRGSEGLIVDDLVQGL